MPNWIYLEKDFENWNPSLEEIESFCKPSEVTKEYRILEMKKMAERQRKYRKEYYRRYGN